MAFDRTKLGLKDSVMNSSMSRDWVYTSADLATVIDTAGYFNDAADLLQVGDRIHVIADSAGTPAYGTMYVSANTAGVVDVNDISLISGGTDTD